MSMPSHNAAPVALNPPTQGEKTVQFKQFLPVALLIATGTLMALQLITAKQAILANADPLAFLSLSLLVAASILTLIAFRRREASRLDRATLIYGLVSGFLFLVPNAVGFLAVEHIGAGFLALTFCFPILITYILALALKMESFQLLRSLAVFLGLVGGLVLAVSKAGQQQTQIIWVILTMCAPIVIAYGNIYRTRQWPAGGAPLFMAALMLATSGVMAFLLAISVSGAGGLQSLINWESAKFLAIQTAILTAMYSLFFSLQKLAGPVYLSQLGSVAAIVGATISVLLLGETLPPNFLIAISLVVGGIALFQYASKRSQ